MKLTKDNTNVDFMRAHKLCLALSGGMIILSIILLFTKGLNLGIDFTGGIMLEIGKPQGMTIEQIPTHLEGISEGTPSIQEFGSDEIMIKIPKPPPKARKLCSTPLTKNWVAALNSAALNTLVRRLVKS